MTHFIEQIGTFFFAIAVCHTFSVKLFHQLASRFPASSFFRKLFHLLGEVEVVFGIWAALFITVLALLAGSDAATQYVDSLQFSEPLFVFATMTIAATRPIIDFAKFAIRRFAKVLPLPGEVGFYFTSLILGPILGSFITEPAAMTVTALVLRDHYFSKTVSSRFKYLTLAVLFVNISIGGSLTPFAAPPILLVAHTWKWDMLFMLRNFAWKAVLAVSINSILATLLCRKDLKTLRWHLGKSPNESPAWLQISHIIILLSITLTSEHPVIFMGIFLLFLGFVDLTKERQEDLHLKQSLLVAFFLSGLVVLGHFQSWWLGPFLQSLGAGQLFVGTTALTAIADNAALTYLGSQIPQLPEAYRYFLVAGAISGGGLTVIANAPNPAGFSILRNYFGPDGISAQKLFLAALIPTLIAACSFWFL